MESEVVSAPEPRQTRGNTERERGRNNTEADDETETRRSALAYIADSAGSFFR